MNFWKHWNKIRIHRKWVRHYCWNMGLYWQGLTHDLSKYSPVEFIESVRFYQGTSSPIDAAKKAKGYSDAWFHHKGRNKHHYEYWVDNLDNGGVPVLMPKKYFLELVADYLGAGRAYYGEDFTFTKEYEWWQNKRKKPLKMDPRQLKMLDTIFSSLADMEHPVWRNGWGEGAITPEEYLASPSGRNMISNIYDTYSKEQL